MRSIPETIKQLIIINVIFYFGSQFLGDLSYDILALHYFENDKFLISQGRDLAQIIDKEISNIIETQYERAIKLLKKHKKKLIELADFLLDKEVIFKEDLIRIYGERPFDLKKLTKK